MVTIRPYPITRDALMLGPQSSSVSGQGSRSFYIPSCQPDIECRLPTMKVWPGMWVSVFSWGQFLVRADHWVSATYSLSSGDERRQSWSWFRQLQHRHTTTVNVPDSFFLSADLSTWLHACLMMSRWLFHPSLISALWTWTRRKQHGGKGSTYTRKAIISQKCPSIFH